MHDVLRRGVSTPYFVDGCLDDSFNGDVHKGRGPARS